MTVTSGGIKKGIQAYLKLAVPSFMLDRLSVCVDLSTLLIFIKVHHTAGKARSVKLGYNYNAVD